MFFEVTVDYSFFQRVCVVMYRRVQRLPHRYGIRFCDELRTLAEQHSTASDSPYPECFPEPAGFGGYLYPHEVFLRRYDLTTLGFWRDLMHTFRHQRITDKQVIAFADELCGRLGIAY